MVVRPRLLLCPHALCEATVLQLPWLLYLPTVTTIMSCLFVHLSEMCLLLPLLTHYPPWPISTHYALEKFWSNFGLA